MAAEIAVPWGHDTAEGAVMEACVARMRQLFVGWSTEVPPPHRAPAPARDTQANASPLREAVVSQTAPANQVAVVAGTVEEGGDAAAVQAPRRPRRRLVMAPRESLPRRAKTEALRRLRRR